MHANVQAWTFFNIRPLLPIMSSCSTSPFGPIVRGSFCVPITSVIVMPTLCPLRLVISYSDRSMFINFVLIDSSKMLFYKGLVNSDLLFNLF